MGLMSFSLKNLSLQKRLPLLVCLLLMVVILLFSIISYIGIKNLELSAGKQRLADLTMQAGSMFSESIREDYLGTKKIISGTAIPAFLSNRNPVNKKRADSVLQEIGNSGTSLCAEILDTAHQILLITGDTSYIPKNRNYAYLNEKLMAGNIYHYNDSIFYCITIPITENEKLLGYVTRHRLVKITSQMINQFSKLAGHGASLYVGNKTDGFFTDLFKPVRYVLPVSQTQAGKSYIYKNDKQARVMGAFQFIPGTPWLVALEFPYNIVVQGSSKFLFVLLLLGSIMIVCGTAAAWFIGRNLINPLKKLTNAVSTISAGEFLQVKVEREDEVGKLASSFNKMSLNLKEAILKMEEKISESEFLNTQLRKLSAHHQNIREEERKRIAREMHDELGQLLTGFKMDIQLLKNHMPVNSGVRVAEHIQSMTALVDDAIKFVRRLSSQLREGPLDDLGLVAALQWYTQEFTKRYNIPVDFNYKNSDLTLSPQVKTGLFRICQESLTNIARHSNATHVGISLEVVDDKLFLSVKDNGKGFINVTSKKTGSLGLLGMNERAIMIGAALSLQSTIGKGTVIEVVLPVNEEQEYLQ